MTLPIHRFLNYIYWWYVEKMDKDGRKDFDAWLAEPLGDQVRRAAISRAPAPSPADLEAEGQDFMAFMGAHAGG